MTVSFPADHIDTINMITTIFTGLTGLEPATSAVTGRCSNQLNYSPRWCVFLCLRAIFNYADDSLICQSFFEKIFSHPPTQLTA